MTQRGKGEWEKGSSRIALSLFLPFIPYLFYLCVICVICVQASHFFTESSLNCSTVNTSTAANSTYPTADA